MSHEERSWIEIDLNNFSENLSEIKKRLLPHQGFMQVVKADAYGHGAYQIAKTAIKEGAVMLGVANAEEGVLLRFHGIKCPILILSPSIISETDSIINYELTPSLSETEFCKALDRRAKELNKIIPVQIKIDSGMNRNGIRPATLRDFLKAFQEFSHLRIEGVFSHFASSEDDEDFSRQQEQVFLECLSAFEPDDLKYIHLSNSAGIIRHNNPLCNLVRLGLLSYGIYPEPRLALQIPLQAVMAFKSKVTHLSHAFKGESIGYNRTYTASKDMSYALVPVGYADGYDFMLSNKSSVLIKDQLCPVVGKISMDMICVDVSAVSDLQLFEEVSLLGHEKPEINPSFLAGLYHGSAYELLSQLGRRAKRFYLSQGAFVDYEPLQRRSFVPLDFSSEKLNVVIQQAIAQRIQSRELSQVIYKNILKYFFTDSDRDISYRSNFIHSVEFSESDLPDFFKVRTYLSFDKILQNETFTVVCANDSDKLNYFFKQSNCEYRWLLDKNLELNFEMFRLKGMSINGKSLAYRKSLVNSCLVYSFSEPELCGQSGRFYIETETLYPKNSHQLSIYINEITKGVEVNFAFLKDSLSVETTLVFSGRERFPQITESMKDSFIKNINIKTTENTWVFPSSGIVFSF